MMDNSIGFAILEGMGWLSFEPKIMRVIGGYAYEILGWLRNEKLNIEDINCIESFYTDME